MKRKFSENKKQPWTAQDAVLDWDEFCSRVKANPKKEHEKIKAELKSLEKVKAND
jgi:hypothetical protein